MNDLFSKSLLQNEITFVQLFLDYDFPLDELFDNNNKILSLYENEVNHSRTNLNEKKIRLFLEL